VQGFDHEDAVTESPGARSRGEQEAEFTRAIIRLEKEYLGRGPQDVRTFFVNDMIIVRIRGVLTPAELKLCETAEGRSLIKETRRQLFERARPFIEEIVQQVTGAIAESLHTDMSTKTGERVLVVTVTGRLDSR
jgi:uncharacterized protein YbcI